MGYYKKCNYIVKFKSWEEMEKEFGLDENGNINTRFPFKISMKHLCNNSFLLKSISWGNHLHFENDCIASKYLISGDMVK